MFFSGTWSNQARSTHQFLFLFFSGRRYNERHRLLLRCWHHHRQKWRETRRYYVQREVLETHRAEGGRQYGEVSAGLKYTDGVKGDDFGDLYHDVLE